MSVSLCCVVDFGRCPGGGRGLWRGSGQIVGPAVEVRQQGGTLTILAASSLIDAFGELGNRFEEQNPGVKVKQSFESSSTLLTQIQQGAPADVFASAAQEEMDTAVKDGLVAGEPEVFVKNREIVMVPKDNPAGIKEFRDVAKPGVKLVLAQKDVPAADYALEILGKANAEYGADFEKDVLSNVVSRESDVRASVNRVVVGDADATFGYASDYTPDIRRQGEGRPDPTRPQHHRDLPHSRPRGRRRAPSLRGSGSNW